MSDFHGFFQKAGFIAVGRTKGNVEAVTPRFEGNGRWIERPNNTQYHYLTNQKSKPYLVYPLDKKTKTRVLAQSTEQRAAGVSSHRTRGRAVRASTPPIHAGFGIGCATSSPGRGTTGNRPLRRDARDHLRLRRRAGLVRVALAKLVARPRRHRSINGNKT